VSIITTNSKRLQEFNFLLGERTQRSLCLGVPDPSRDGSDGCVVTRVTCVRARGREGGRIKSSLTVPPLKLGNKKIWLQCSVGNSATYDTKYLPTWPPSADN